MINLSLTALNFDLTDKIKALVDEKLGLKLDQYLQSFDPDQSPDFLSKEVLKEFRDRRLKLKENWKGYFYYFVMKNIAFDSSSLLLNDLPSEHCFQRAA